MFTEKNTIIIVDDQQDHLDRLASQFHGKGIGCRPILYDPFYNNPLKNVRIAFFDINLLNPSGSSDSQIFNALAVSISQYIHPENGPFALIFWTSNAGLVERFKEYMQARRGTAPKPILVNFIDKDQFFGHDLETKLREILADPILELLFDLETKVTNASALSINHLYSIIPNNDTWGNNNMFKENVEKIFSKITMSTLGIKNAKLTPGRGLYETFIPMITHQILNNPESSIWADTLSSLRSATTPSDVNLPSGFKESILNTVFHIEETNHSNNIRGVVLKLNKSSKRIQKLLNLAYVEWVKSFIPFKKDFRASESEQRLRSIDTLILNSKLVAIEISAACDFQQNNNRLNKYLCGVLIDVIDKNLKSSQKAGGALYVGTFFMKQKEFEIWVNLNYVFGALESDSILGKPMFILKKEIMDMIGNRYANHISRIGITSF